MESIRYAWSEGNGDHAFDLVHVRGTHDAPYAFGEPPSSRSIEVRDFFISTVPVTQALWTHVMGATTNPAVNVGPNLPLENMSWDDVALPGGFLHRLNESAVAATLREKLRAVHIPTPFRDRMGIRGAWGTAVEGRISLQWK